MNASARKVHSGHIVYALARHFDWFQNTMMTEYFVDGGIADLVFVTRARYLTEVEVKISRADWKVDAEKQKWKKNRPHVSRFFYAVPMALAENVPAWVPETAGIIGVGLSDNEVPFAKEIRAAKRKRCTRLTHAQIAAIHERAYYRFWRREMRLFQGRLHNFAAVA